MGIDRRRLLVLGGAAVIGCASKHETPAPDASGLDASRDAAGDAGADANDVSADAPSCPGVYQGSVDDFSGSWSLVGVGDARMFIVRDDNGLYAYSAICTHESCALIVADAFGRASCPCHGAEFDGNGQVTKGPATKNLPHYLLTICGRKVFVDRSAIVPAHQRAVP